MKTQAAQGAPSTHTRNDLCGRSGDWSREGRATELTDVVPTRHHILFSEHIPFQVGKYGDAKQHSQAKHGLGEGCPQQLFGEEGHLQGGSRTAGTVGVESNDKLVMQGRGDICSRS